MRPPDDALADPFEAQRPRLIRLAYRMLGSMSEAEDVVQDAFLRWHQADRAAVRAPAAYLSRTVTRLCLDVLKSARMRRETYIGPWLPEPVAEPASDSLDEDVSLTLMMALERLSPLERAAFLLHDVFGMGFDEIAATLDREPAACRQLAARARANVRASKPRYAVDRETGARIAEAFFAASRSGDLGGLRALLADSVVVRSDGGGLASAALNPILGFDKVARLLVSVARKTGHARPPVLYRGPINGLPGFVTREADGILQSTALDIQDGRIVAVYIVRNPEKLRHLSNLLTEMP
ncbi:sigma-70 family RNA polymerase sigma factor [Microvirga pudoricolor]|uniref:sigma-70 family RNA polymerase sigma factor n=1 Tax=Microvirga pudoricolor TaxID=2778729 RepID=UPI001951EC5F|nr:sigma-70 family RNA polymerase sigma factor [Microvirga pudoricolor]MBM6593782.1 sigma-70 family RNA polymerase sigma factor [Microvirga pudoricolor]